MTLSGTEVFILYILLCPIARKYFSIRWRYFILKVSMMFYLFPFAWFKFIALDKVFKLFPGLETYYVSNIKNIDLTKYIFIEQNHKIVSWQIKIIWLILCVTGIVSAILIYVQLRGYFKLKRACVDEYICDDAGCIEIFQSAKAALRVKNEVKLVVSEVTDTPFTIGVFHPTIVMPLSMKAFDKADCRYIIEHELNHIKNHDIVFKFMALLATAINWFNPICYFMYRELSNVSELYCDFCTTKGMDSVQRKRYCNLIVDLATEDENKVTKKYVASLVNNDSRIIERRIKELKKYGGSKKIILSCLVGGVICLTGSITSFAYNPPTIYNTAGVTDTNMEIVYQDIALQSQAKVVPYDYFWTDVNGNIFEIKDNNSKAYCPHNYESGTITKHTKYSDNSCKMVYSNAQKCKLCDRVNEGSVIKTVTYTQCPH